MQTYKWDHTKFRNLPGPGDCDPPEYDDDAEEYDGDGRDFFDPRFDDDGCDDDYEPGPYGV